MPFGDRLDKAGVGKSYAGTGKQGWRSLIIPSLLWLLVLTAQARPQWLEPPVSRKQPPRDLHLLLDLSGSMRQEDFTNTAGGREIVCSSPFLAISAGCIPDHWFADLAEVASCWMCEAELEKIAAARRCSRAKSDSGMQKNDAHGAEVAWQF